MFSLLLLCMYDGNQQNIHIHLFYSFSTLYCNLISFQKKNKDALQVGYLKVSHNLYDDRNVSNIGEQREIL